MTASSNDPAAPPGPAPSGAPAPSQAPSEAQPLEITGSRLFGAWLGDMGVSLGFTTYQAGRLFLVGVAPDGRLSVFQRALPRCMGMAAHRGSLYVATLYELFRFEDALTAGADPEGYDRVYLPQVGYITGDVDIHDVAVDASGRPVFANTLFSCLATVSESHSFVPLWRPPFISRLAAEDRCHLNGVALREGAPAYATAVAETDLAEGWREHRHGGGVVIDVEAGEVVGRGLSMPHSPRWYRGRLWLHDSGSGYFGWLDPARGHFEPMTFCPGYLRGLAFVGDHAVVGLSRPRGNRTFSGLDLDGNLARYKAEPRCGVYVIDIRSGDVVHTLSIEGPVQELYDVCVLPETRRPKLIGFHSAEVRRMVSIGPQPERP